MRGAGVGRTLAEQKMHREKDHVVRHGTERDNDDDPDEAREHAVVDGPVRDLVKNLFVKTTFSSLPTSQDNLNSRCLGY